MPLAMISGDLAAVILALIIVLLTGVMLLRRSGQEKEAQTAFVENHRLDPS